MPLERVETALVQMYSHQPFDCHRSRGTAAAIFLLFVLICATKVAAKSKVLVIGATGRVGRAVVDKLLASSSYEVRVLSRSSPSDAKLGPGVEVYLGDVLNKTSLLASMKNVDVVVDVHGVTPPRLTSVFDFFKRNPNRLPLNHPYHVNLCGTKNVIECMKDCHVKKLVRLTGALVGKNVVVSPVVALFNIILSMTVKYHERSEIEIRKSGINYAVVRPTGIRDEAPAADTNRTLILSQGDRLEKIPMPGKISIADLSDLLVISASDRFPNKCSVVVSSKAGTINGPVTWQSLLPKLVSDYKTLKAQKHTFISLVYFLTFVLSSATIVKLAIIILMKGLGLLLVASTEAESVVLQAFKILLEYLKRK